MVGVMSGNNPTPGPTSPAAVAAAKAKAAAIAEALSKLPPPMAAAGINPD
jgi:penicillin-binding protein 2